MTADVQKVKLHVHRMRCAMDTGFCRNETLLLHLSTRVQGHTLTFRARQSSTHHNQNTGRTKNYQTSGSWIQYKFYVPHVMCTRTTTPVHRSHRIRIGCIEHIHHHPSPCYHQMIQPGGGNLNQHSYPWSETM